MLLVINDDNFKNERHICWYTVPGRDDGGSVELHEVVLREYPHPDAPEEAVIPIFETKFVRKFKRSSLEGASLVLLEAAEKNTTKVHGRSD